MEAPQGNSENTFIKHLPCEKCGSKDNNALYSDGSTYCFGCEEYASAEGTVGHKATKVNAGLLPGTYAALPARGLTEETCRKFDYQIGFDGTRPVQIANYRNDSGQVSAQKIRDADKNFKILGDGKDMQLFGQHLWTGGRKIVICEGEVDTCTVSQVQGNKWPTVGLPLGAQSGKKALLKAWDYLLEFDEIVLMFDQDDAGQKAALDCAEALPVGRVKIATLPEKDANECLKKGLEKEIINAIWRAKEWKPEGIVSASSLLDIVGDLDELSTVAYPFQKLNEITKGIRPATLVTICAGSGVGKSTFVTEIAYALQQSGQKVGMLMLEETNKRTVQGLVAVHMNTNFVQEGDLATKKEIQAAHGDLLKDTDIELWDHFGSSSLDVVVNRIQYMVRATGCQHIILDHISILVSGLTGEVTDERRLIDLIMHKLRTTVQELGITLFLVSHLKRPQGIGHEAGAKVELSQLRGSHSIAQLADQCIGLQVNAEDPSDDTREIVVLKNRFTGQVGFAGRLKYHRSQSRLLEISDMDSKF